MVWIPPEALSISASTEITCVILDATFSCIKKFVLTVVSVCIRNSYLPIGISIGTTENADLYKRFYQEFSKITSFQLNSIPVLSDRHTWIESFCKEFHINHYYCLTHIFRSFGSHGHLIFFVKRLLKITADSDLLEYLDFVSVTLSEEMHNQNFINKIKSIGLEIENNKIVVDQTTTLFQKCSAISRISKGIPLTTNSIESVHGHLNYQRARHSTFWHEVQNVINLIFSRFQNFEEALKTNYNNRIRKLAKLLDNYSAQTLEAEKVNYNTTPEHCNCGQTLLFEKMFGIEIPCIHRITMGKQYTSDENLPLPTFANPKRFKSFVAHDTIISEKDEGSKLINYHFPDDVSNKERKTISQPSQFFEKTVDIVFKFTHAKKKLDRDTIATLLVDIYYSDILSNDKMLPIKSPMFHAALTHLCILYIEKDGNISINGTTLPKPTNKNQQRNQLDETNT
jgi:hypothetical protein